MAKQTSQNVRKENPKRFEGVSVGKDAKGFYVYTHRARSASYPTQAAIPASQIKAIERTG